MKGWRSHESLRATADHDRGCFSGWYRRSGSQRHHRSKRYNRVKVANYECGLEPTPSAGASGRFPIKYFLTAMTFIIFDIEVVFLYPWAVSANRLGLASLIAIASFVFLITIPFIYEWRRGGLDWE